MKRLFAWIFSFLLFALSPAQAVGVAAGPNGFGDTAQLPQEPSGIDAGAYILMEMESGRMLAGRNIHDRLAMASTTKIMTALLTLEQPDLDAYFTVDAKAILVEGSSMGLLPGDRVSLRGLAVGMLLHSGNDSAGAAAAKVGGTVEGFVAMMNERAAQMGLADTHFATPSGLDADDHYSSAYDMAVLAQNALQNEDFLAICSAAKARISFGNPPYERWLQNHNRLLEEYEGCIGVKTGFTKKAGRCLVSAARREGITLICVTLSAADDWNVHKKLFDYGFSCVQKIDLATYLPEVSLPVVGGVMPSVRARLDGDTTAAVLLGEERQILARVYIDPFYYAPLQAEQKVGEVEFYLGDQKLGSWDLYPQRLVAAQIVAQKGLWDQIKSWFGG
ncbi:MAG: D-alanyl-D-alanine carboxypeptidase [Oscillospiraceae bacterium]|nr:D-alanyl-D-alanine carboxypeptidase [Oscillospiraceae bacterium]